MRLAADANVILSVVVGGRAKLILTSPPIDEISTVAPIQAEVEEYASLLAEQKRLAEDVVLLAVGALPLTIVDRADYAAAIPEAMERFGQRDPDDAELLALALTLDVPLWSNDKDFDRTGVTRFTTNALLRQLAL